MHEELFLSNEQVNFYRFYDNSATQETRFLAKPKNTECMMFVEQMNGALNLMHQHMKFRQYKEEKFLPKVEEFNAQTGEIALTVPANLSSAVPTVVIEHNNIIIVRSNAAWITKQAFLLASLAYEAGIVLPISVENFLVCYKSETFVLLDWSMAQVVEIGRISTDVAQKQVVDLADLLMGLVDYRCPPHNATLCDSFLRKFILDASHGMFATASEAQQALSRILE